MPFQFHGGSLRFLPGFGQSFSNFQRSREPQRRLARKSLRRSMFLVRCSMFPKVGSAGRMPAAHWSTGVSPVSWQRRKLARVDFEKRLTKNRLRHRLPP